MNRANGWCLTAVLTVVLTVSAFAGAGMFVQVASAANETVTLHDSAQGADITGNNVTDGETVYIKVTNTNSTAANGTVDITSSSGSASVTVYDDGTFSDDQSGDGTYWGSFTIGTDIAVSDGNDATVTADLDGDGSSGSASVTVDGTPPAIQTATTNDSDANGAVDNVTVTFTEPINDSTVSTGDFTVDGSTPSSYRTGTADDAVVHLSLSSEISGTGVTPPVTLTTNGVADLAGNANTSGGTVTAADGASPVARSGRYADTNADGTVDAINVTFSEDVQYSSSAPYAGTEWTVNANGITGLQLNGTGTVVDAGSTLSLPATADPMLTGNSSALAPNVTYAVGSGGDVVDTAATPNEAVDGTNATLNDSARPTVADLAISDSAHDGLVDAVNVTFTEWVTPANGDTLSAAEFENGTGVALTLPDGSTADLSGASFVHPTNSAYVNVTGVAGQASANTAAGATTLTGDLSDEWNDTADNRLVSSLGSVRVVDSAVPVATNATYDDVADDGTVDTVNVTYSESVAGYTDADWTIPSAERGSRVNLSRTGSGRISGDRVEVDVTGATNVTGGGTTPTIVYTAGTLADGHGNAAPSQPLDANDSAPPRAVTVTTVDSDRNGTVDQLAVTFTEPVDDASLATGDFTGVSVVGVSNPAGTDDNRTTLTVTGLASGDTSVTPTLGVTASGLTDRSPLAVSGPEGGDQSLVAADGAAPVTTAAVADDTDGDGNVDQINVTLSEPINDSASTVDASTYAIDPGTVDDVTTGAAADDAALTLNVSGLTGTGATPDATLQANALYDAHGNSIGRTQMFTGTTSRAPPKVRSVSVLDRDGDGNVDAANVTFSAPMDDATIAPADWAINGTTVDTVDTLAAADDDALQLRLADGNEVDGTTATNVTYTAGTATAGNGQSLADVTAGDVTETDAAAPRIESMTVTKPDSRTVRVNVTAGEPLATTRVRITSGGTQVGTLTTFTESGSGPYTYTATYDASGAGGYTAELTTAADAAGNDGAADESGTVTLPAADSGGGGGSVPSISGAVTQSTSVPVADSEPGQPGTTVPFGDGTTDSITFDGRVTGRVTVAQLSSVPSDVAGDDGGDAVNGAPVLRSVRITASEDLRNTPATLRLTVSRDQLDGRSPERLGVVRFTDEGPQRLQSDVVRTTGEQVVVEARTPGFSVFTVILADEDAETTATPTPRPGGTPTPSGDGTPSGDATATADGTATPEPDGAGTETTSETIPGFTVELTLVALVAAALLARRRRR